MKWRGAYSATKFAMEGLSDTLRLEMRGTGVEIILIEPGPVTSQIRINSIPHFEKFVDWKNSARRDEYESSLIDRLYQDRGLDPFELPASAVSAKLRHACEAKRPKPRYFVTKPTYAMAVLRRILSTRALDRILSKI